MIRQLADRFDFQLSYGISKLHYARIVVIGAHAASRSFVFVQSVLHGYLICKQLFHEFLLDSVIN
ncbi:hypothetical protein CLV99_3191 [Sphingobacterium yanglingense]|uniref:Uncharacterized protein n=1 Tax=Sphingobacterium yanglingense TaxID=1437280 RepID=A0A4R6WB50_9SPHI|nr:hypothetical protein CLV99_3191 [Sphingobacterium yanglingense]